MMNVDTKICSKCKIEKPLGRFEFAPLFYDKLRPDCKDCRSAQARKRYLQNPGKVCLKTTEWWRKNSEKALVKTRQRKYGLSLEEFQLLSKLQNDSCPGCLRCLTAVKVCVDHDHVTGKVRGLLCNECNLALGWARDNLETLLRLGVYLEAHGRHSY